MTEPQSDPASPPQIVEGNPAEPVFARIVEDVLQRGVRVRFRASGSSMAPAILDGDAITVEPVAPAQLRRGDVLLVRRGDGVVAHRLVGRARAADGDLELVLRGDAAESDDKALPAVDVLGRVVEVEHRRVSSRPSSWLARCRALLRLHVRGVRQQLRL